MKSRIAYLCSRYPAISHTFVMREIESLRDRGVEIETFTIRRSPARDLLSEADRSADLSTHSLLPAAPSALLRAHLAAASRHPARYLSTLLRALRLRPPGVRGVLWQVFYFGEAMLLWHECVRREIEHVHVHFANVAADVALLASHFGRLGAGLRSWSFTMHGPTEFYEVGAHRLAEKAADAAFVVCISDFARSQLMSLLDPSDWERLHVIRCGVDTDNLVPEELPLRNAGSLRILCVAQLSARKGQAVLLEAVAALCSEGIELSLTLAGDGPERSRLERQAVELGLGKHVRFLGAVGHDRIPVLHREADVFCLPSFGEGLPVVLMEAMALGTAVVATNVMAVAELVEHQRSGLLVPPGRSDALGVALRRLAQEPKLRRDLAEEARSRVVADYDLRRSAQELERLFGCVGSP